MTLSAKRLKRLARHRERLERLQEERLAEARQQHTRRARTLAETEARREDLYESGAPASGAIEPDEWSATGAYLLRLQREIGARRAALAHSAESVEVERRELMERRRGVKAIETLLDHQADEERLLASRADIKRIDELAGRRWIDRQS